jgi:imidazolonepropionase-like amidohydrolase
MFLVGLVGHAQDYFPENKGVKTQNSKKFLLTGATIHLNPLQKIENGMLLIENGKITAVGTTLQSPKMQ